MLNAKMKDVPVNLSITPIDDDPVITYYFMFSFFKRMKEIRLWQIDEKLLSMIPQSVEVIVAAARTYMGDAIAYNYALLPARLRVLQLKMFPLDEAHALLLPRTLTTLKTSSHVKDDFCNFLANLPELRTLEFDFMFDARLLEKKHALSMPKTLTCLGVSLRGRVDDEFVENLPNELIHFSAETSEPTSLAKLPPNVTSVKLSRNVMGHHNWDNPYIPKTVRNLFVGYRAGYDRSDIAKLAMHLDSLIIDCDREIHSAIFMKEKEKLANKTAKN